MQQWIRIFHGWAIASREWPVWIRYLITTATVASVFLGVRVFATAGKELLLLPLLIVILLAGALLDRGNGLYATALSAILVAFQAVPARSTAAVADAQSGWELALFVVLGVAISVVVEAMHVVLVALSIEHRAALGAAHDRKVLLDELSHRTRNDLASVATLLNMQARSASDETAAALKIAAGRVYAVARVHRTLSLSGDRVVVDSRSYLDELCEDVQLSLVAARPIKMQWKCESHRLTLGKAVPIGLILNEAVTNAVKHAFPDGRPGRIDVAFVRSGAVYELTVADDGAGVSDTPRDGSLGRHLVRMLAGQLGGEATIEARASGGTLMRVTIPRLLDED